MNISLFQHSQTLDYYVLFPEIHGSLVVRVRTNTISKMRSVSIPGTNIIGYRMRQGNNKEICMSHISGGLEDILRKESIRSASIWYKMNIDDIMKQLEKSIIKAKEGKKYIE